MTVARAIENASPAWALAPGDLASVVFPRMAGKRRPGVVLHRTADGPRTGEGGAVAVPFTTRRTNQPGRITLPEAERAALGLARPCQALTARASWLPLERVAPLGCAVSPAFLAQLLGEMVEWYGLDWRAEARSLAQAAEKARRLRHAARPGAA